MASSSNRSVEDAFFAYAKGKTSLSPSLITLFLQKAEEFCQLKQPLLGITDVKTVRNVQQRVAEGKLLHFRFGKDAQAIRNVTQLYYTFIKSYREPKDDIAEQTVQSATEQKPTEESFGEGIQESDFVLGSSEESSSIEDGTIIVPLEAFKGFLLDKQQLADRTAGNYCTSIRMIEEYIRRNELQYGFIIRDEDNSYFRAQFFSVDSKS